MKEVNSQSVEQPEDVPEKKVVSAPVEALKKGHPLEGNKKPEEPEPSKEDTSSEPPSEFKSDSSSQIESEAQPSDEILVEQGPKVEEVAEADRVREELFNDERSSSDEAA